MTAAVLDPTRLEAHLRDLMTRERLAGASRPGSAPRSVIVAYRASGWTGPATVRVLDREFDVVHCPSVLAVREALSEREGSGRSLVLLTDQPDQELGADVRARLARRRVILADDWGAVMERFQARTLDPRLLSEAWMPEALLAAAPANGYPAVPAGYLDAETAWRWLLEARLGFPAEAPSVEALLSWSVSPDRVRKFEAQPERLREGFARWVGERVGAGGRAILRAIETGHGGDVLPLGLVVGLLAPAGVAWDPRWAKAQGKLEALFDLGHLEATNTARWAEASETLVARTFEREGRSVVAGWFDRTQRILLDIGGEDLAAASRWLPKGEVRRLDSVAEALGAALASTPAAVDGRLEAAAAAVREHHLAAGGSGSAAVVGMALRLARWLARAEALTAHPATLGDAVEAYREDGAHVDWARRSLPESGLSPSLRAAFGSLMARVDVARERENERFAHLLAAWAEGGAQVGSLLPIERVVPDVVGPLASGQPVLLLVLDGMSSDVFRELLSDLSQRGWIELTPAATRATPRVLAAFPTVTEVSRASLFAGRLCRGDSTFEEAEFASHPALRQASKAKKGPRLFHKQDLEAHTGVGLAPDVRASIADPEQRVVGVVVNAVDDWLLKGDQLRPVWDAAHIRPLDAILNAAREVGRVVVLTSDHGHVIERGSRFRPDTTGGERFRVPSGSAAEGEIVLRGPRVVGVPGNVIAAPWSERLCYGVKRNGYHGGATPQEVIVPLAVLTAGAEAPKDWVEVPSVTPSWWDAGSSSVGEPLAPPVVPLPPPVPVPQGELFPTAPEKPEPHREPVGWVEALLASSAWKGQAKIHARTAPEPERVKAVLSALAERGGKLTRPALAARLQMPVVRLVPVLAVMRRMLNIDGYVVLGQDEASDTVVLNLALLRSQFGIE